jgi:hypothetical protein
VFLSIQFPLADSRAFVSGGTNLLGRPTWPSVSPDIDFVRSFGSIRKRKLGGLPGWVGETAICEATRALRFTRITHYKDAPAKLSLGIDVVFRRFYFDGLAVGKFELGFSTDNRGSLGLNRKQTSDFLDHCLSLPVTVPALSNKAVAPSMTRTAVQTELGRVGKSLAGFYAACSVSHPPPAQLMDWWVLTGTPLLVLIHNSSEKVHIPYLGKSVPRSEILKADLSSYEVPYQGKTIRMWVIGLGERTNYRDVRALKICLLRLHAEHEALRLILQNVSTNKIAVLARSSESNALQRYLNEATRKIARLSTEADDLAEGELAELARESEEMVNPGERDSLLTTLKNLDIRKNIFAKVEDYMKTEINVKELYMEAKYKITGGTQGAVGDNAQASNNTFNTWNQSGGDLKALAGELAQLRAELGKQAKSAEEFESAAAVAKAEDAAQKGDGSAAFDYLKSAGKWALEAATSIGIPVAIQAIKTALGAG